jgi:hypothetical protein
MLLNDSSVSQSSPAAQDRTRWSARGVAALEPAPAPAPAAATPLVELRVSSSQPSGLVKANAVSTPACGSGQPLIWRAEQMAATAAVGGSSGDGVRCCSGATSASRLTCALNCAANCSPSPPLALPPMLLLMSSPPTPPPPTAPLLLPLLRPPSAAAAAAMPLRAAARLHWHTRTGAAY